MLCVVAHRLAVARPARLEELLRALVETRHLPGVECRVLNAG
jgi:hypothetical protein